MVTTATTSIQAFARYYLETSCLEVKCNPGKVPTHFAVDAEPLDLRPRRPAELRVTQRRPRSFKRGALERPEVRAALHHKFWHHELQAAELFCWAILRFSDAPQPFRKGLVRIFKDELRHMGMYQRHIEALGFKLTDFEIRDWFWDRVPLCTTPLEFVALLGMGLEGANLEHTARFESWFRAVGDHAAAEIQEQVGREEVAHVRFAIRWFREWTGAVDFDTWCCTLPAPLTPLLMRGKTIHQSRRIQAEFPQGFIERLRSWHPSAGPVSPP